jgi:hypothetical protein
MITKEWKDFVLAPVGSFIDNVEDRFNLPGGGRLVTLGIVEQFGDKFEAMEITELGDITLWTTSKVWCIRKEPRLEKLIYLLRNPP